ncbi:TUL4 family lipoprotein [Cysteiniphilum halobium]|uniref:TUL4 family lipoprotein n=1 Tax=Cysteiniphilum halobium TaxID=2219059 RepID=UPI000E65017F|nr:TUL4 family lipoprotein [Cysteiniphilum halobium]
MRKITLLGIVSSAALLSACATSPQASAPQSTDASVKAMSAPTTVSTTKTASSNSALPSSTVKLSAKDGRLVAKIYTDWNSAKQGDLKLHWVAPRQSHCISTTFPIMKYKETNDYSWAYRTLEHQSANGAISCPGVWKAEVVYTPTKAVVGQAKLNVAATQQ